MARDSEYNPPAFPKGRNDGMTLRDWFAGQALASMKMYPTYTPDYIARNAYDIADAMLRERAVSPGYLNNDDDDGDTSILPNP